MKPRRLYWRKKGKALILEGRLGNGKPLLIWTLPEANKFYSEILANASFLTKEKQQNINQKVQRLAFKDSATREAKENTS